MATAKQDMHLSLTQVALKLLRCWQGVVVNSQDYVKPYIHGLLPPVVSSGSRCLLISTWAVLQQQ
jgi:hypothetical protein